MLVSLPEASQPELSCKRCGSDARVAPSCSYSDADREQFEELSCVVAEANTTRTEAIVYAEAVQHALWAGNYAEKLEKLCGRMPGLLPTQIAAGKNAAAQRRILVKLQSILQAQATAPRGSAQYSIAVEPARARGARG